MPSASDAALNEPLLSPTLAQGAKGKSCSTKAAKLDTLACALCEKVSDDHVVLCPGLCLETFTACY